MRNVSGKSRENQKAYFKVKKIPQHRAVYEVMWKNMVGPERLQMAV